MLFLSYLSLGTKNLDSIIIQLTCYPAVIYISKKSKELDMSFGNMYTWVEVDCILSKLWLFLIFIALAIKPEASIWNGFNFSPNYYYFFPTDTWSILHLIFVWEVHKHAFKTVKSSFSFQISTMHLWKCLSGAESCFKWTNQFILMTDFDACFYSFTNL